MPSYHDSKPGMIYSETWRAGKKINQAEQRSTLSAYQAKKKRLSQAAKRKKDFIVIDYEPTKVIIKGPDSSGRIATVNLWFVEDK